MFEYNEKAKSIFFGEDEYIIINNIRFRKNIDHIVELLNKLDCEFTDPHSGIKSVFKVERLLISKAKQFDISIYRTRLLNIVNMFKHKIYNTILNVHPEKKLPKSDHPVREITNRAIDLLYCVGWGYKLLIPLLELIDFKFGYRKENPDFDFYLIMDIMRLFSAHEYDMLGILCVPEDMLMSFIKIVLYAHKKKHVDEWVRLKENNFIIESDFEYNIFKYVIENVIYKFEFEHNPVSLLHVAIDKHIELELQKIDN